MMRMKNLTHTSSIVIAFFFCMNNPFESQRFLLAVDAQEVAVKIGVVLDKESMEGKIGLSCIKMAISDFYAAHSEFKTRIVLDVRDSKRHDVVTAAVSVLDLVKNEEVAAIIGPETSGQAQFIVNLGERSQVPIVSYSSSSPFLSPLQNPYFIQATQDDSTQVQPIGSLIQAFGWREVIPVYAAEELGGGVIPFLADVLQQNGTHIPYRSVLPSAATDDRIEAELYKLKSMSTRVFLVHMEPSLGSRLFLKAKQIGMMSEGYVWIITNAMANMLESLDRHVSHSMQGVLGIKTHVPKTRELVNFTTRWELEFQQENPAVSDARMNVDGLWAYDATTAIAHAVEEAGVSNYTFQRYRSTNNLSSNDTPDIGVSIFGPQLLKAIKRSKFRGLSGNFVLVDGQLQHTAFSLINVVGIEGKSIGQWRHSSGFVEDMTQASTSSDSTLNAAIKSIRWPGNSPSVPKGWVASPNGKKLRIGVPKKNGFHKFVTVTRDPATNEMKVSGYCIDVFEAVISKLPYSVLYEYIPFTEHDSQPSYNTLMYQVYLGNFDAVVGDVTIRANRSLYVDFTFPYTESGVIMVVPMKSNKNIRAWLFIKPLTWELWVTTLCSFIFIAFVVWLLEHRINEDFRGPPRHQVGTSLYYSFSTMVFSHSFNVFNNLTRFVVIIWIYVVLILVQSYTANLASLLTVDQLQPTIRDMRELIKNGETVGYQQGSFVKQQLIQLGFKDSHLKSYNTTHHLDELLTMGTQRGGISAAVDELPYIQVFMAEYPSKYTTVPPTHKTDGFGFVFPKGSPLGSDVSRNVLNITEGEEMKAIENKWFKKTDCADLRTSLSSNSLGLDSFWGLFTIAGVAAFSALIISLVGFLKKHKNVWSDGSSSVWSRIKTMSNIYDQRSISSHTFRKGQMQEQCSVGTAPNSPYLQSPSSYWNNSERGFSNYEEQSTPSSGKINPNSSRSENLEDANNTHA